MNDLESFIRNNREAFNDEEPPRGHLYRFEKKLRSQAIQDTQPQKRTVFFRIAAVIVLLIGVTVFIFDPYNLNFLRPLQQVSVTLPYDLAEAMDYYETRVQREWEEIDRLAGNSTEGRLISENAWKEIQILDANNNELKAAFAQNPNNERIAAAMILNQQMKEDVLSTFRNTINLHK